jgi:hypothetical protein
VPAARDDAIYVEPLSGAERSERGWDSLIAEVADRQHGFVERGQLLGLGMGRRAIGYRLAAERLHPHHRGVYGVGHRAVTKHGCWMAAVLAGGEGAVLSHWSAAQLWGLRDGIRIPVQATVPRARRRQTGIRFHRSPLPFDEITTHDGIPVTTVPRTILDLAASSTPRQIERLINEADVHKLWDRLSLDDLLHRHPRRAGAAALRKALEGRRAGATVTKSELEEMFIGFLDEFGLPRPEANPGLPAAATVYEPDCLWREHRLVVELDSRQFHDTIEAFEADRERDRHLTLAGWRTIRVTHRMLTAGRRELGRDLKSLLDHTP